VVLALITSLYVAKPLTYNTKSGTVAINGWSITRKQESLQYGQRIKTETNRESWRLRGQKMCNAMRI